MKKLEIKILEVVVVGNEAEAVVTATNSPEAEIQLRLKLYVPTGVSARSAAYEMALQYLDIA